PLDASIPTIHGGRGADPREILSVLEASAYESLPLSLMLAISGALFAEPMAKYADGAVAGPVFERMRHDGALGGLMITEPEYGTDALGMRTHYREDGERFVISGEKHWAGLTGWADYWLVTARRAREDGTLNRAIDFFFCDSRQPDQLIRVEEYYNNLGLYMIPYGRNRIELSVPVDHKLDFAGSGTKLMQDLLHRSRMRFPGMALGFIRRALDEALNHCRNRLVGGKALHTFDQVQRRLAQLQGWFTTASAFCREAAKRSGIELNLVKEGLVANIQKTLMSDYMQQASQSVLQLVGAKGYRQDHFAGRSTNDTRPFQIFEGSNDVIYQQVADGFLKSMARAAEHNVARFLSDHQLTRRGIEYVKDMLNFSVDDTLSQRKRVDLGRIFSRVTAIDWTLSLGDGGFNGRLIGNAVAQLREEIGALLGSFVYGHDNLVLEYYADNVDWSPALQRRDPQRMSATASSTPIPFMTP
ncbi:MAG: acyl-CoA dehydrogenase, partial [Spirochaetales bacterium]|nr:acyl-CoA dehydrogenase [Spirochaetales bacterium]